MHLYGGSGKHSKKKPEKEKKYEEYDYGAGYGEDYDYEDYDYEPAPRQSHSRNAGQTRKTEPKPRRSEPQRRSRRRDSEDIRSTNRTVYGGNGYDYEDDLRFASDAYISREEQRRNKHRGRGALITICVLLILCIGGYAGFKMWAKPAATQDNGPNTYDSSDSDDSSSAGGVDGVAPGQADSNRRPGVWTFLVSGLDREGLHTDTNIVGMFDTVEGKLNLVNLPRDLLINIPISPKQMNQPYPASINNGGDGISALLDAVKDILGYEVDCWAVIDIQATADIVEAIGGVYYDIPFDMDWDAPDQNPPVSIHIKQGYQLLDGDDFVNAMRFRISNDGSNTYIGGDIERIAFQQKLLMALARQTLSLENIPNLTKIFEIYEKRVDTNVSVGNLAYFATEFMKLDADSITFQTIPSKGDGYALGKSYVLPYIDEWLEVINEYLNPFTVEITRENINMISYDMETGTWDMTQGYIAGQ